MEFPIMELMDQRASVRWIVRYFHPDGLKCPRCASSVDHARVFRTTRRSHLTVYRCRCGQTYNIYSGTVFEQRHLTPAQVVLLIRGIFKDESSLTLAGELNITYATVLALRHALVADQTLIKTFKRFSSVADNIHEIFNYPPNLVLNNRSVARA